MSKMTHTEIFDLALVLSGLKVGSRKYRNLYTLLQEHIESLGEDAADMLYWSVTKDDLDRPDYKLLAEMVNACYPLDLDYDLEVNYDCEI